MKSSHYVMVDSPRRQLRDDARAKALGRDRGRTHRPRGPGAQGPPCRPGQDRRRRRPDPSGSGVCQCFSTKVTNGVFAWDYDEEAMDYEESSLVRYVITTSLDNKAASTVQVIAHYKSLQSVDGAFGC